MKSIQCLFAASLKKLSTHLDNHPTMAIYKATRIFYPAQLPSLSLNIANYTAITAFEEASAELFNEWSVYTNIFQEENAVPDDLSVGTLAAFWKSLQERFPTLSAVAREAIWIPVSSVDVERSFSQYMLNEFVGRESLADDNTKKLMQLYYNGDIGDRLRM